MSELRFNVFGRLVAIVGTQGTWSAFFLGGDGKRRSADFIVPGSLGEESWANTLQTSSMNMPLRRTVPSFA